MVDGRWRKIIGLLSHRKRRISSELRLAAWASGLFDAESYAARAGLRRRAAALDHYMTRGRFEGLDPGPGFSVSWYVDAYPDVAIAGFEPFEHYLLHGEAEGRDPSPPHPEIAAIRASGLFEAEAYAMRNGLANAREALQHYLTLGWREGQTPGPRFDGAWYLSAYPEVRAEGAEPLSHYLLHGEAEGRDPLPPTPETVAIRASGLFEAQAYAIRNGLRNNRDALDHYRTVGWREGQDPGPNFSVGWYRSAYPDIPDGVEPLLHYVLHGEAEGRDPLPPTPETVAIRASGLFEAQAYAIRNGLRNERDALDHYRTVGWREGQDPGPNFSVGWYRSAYPDIPDGVEPLLHYVLHGEAEGRDPLPPTPETVAIRASGLFEAQAYAIRNGLRNARDALDHYRTVGWREGQNPGVKFSVDWYLQTYADIASAGIEPLAHYVIYGRDEGRYPVRPDPAVTAIRASGLLDESWYRRQAETPDDVDVAEHYLSTGWKSGRDPGPFFSVKGYLDAYPDIRNGGIEPLRHFHDHGRQEGRRIGRVPESGPGEGPYLDLRCSELRAVGSIIVVVHAFYPDVFEELCPLLRGIPVHFTLGVTVSDPADVARIEAAVSKAGLDAGLVCRVARNRGRNFGAMLSEFSDEIAARDFLLHLHTKRSLYSGREQTEWRESLYRALISSRMLICGLLDIFLEKPDVGLIYPTIFRGLPYWAHHWLSNGHHAPALLRRLGVADVPQGYLDYPVGGMFWARVEALRPLFEAGFTYDDFEPEAGQTDGTLAHAMERAVGALSADRGYRFVEVEYESGLLRDGWSDHNLSQYQHQGMGEFTRRLEMTDLVSFDIFDTLVVRPALKPDAILHYAGHRMNRRLPKHHFFKLRKMSETRARRLKTFKGDVDIHEIYAQFPRRGGWTETLVDMAKTFELDLDLAVVRPRPRALDMVQAARSRGLRVIAVSDTYLPPAVVEAILDKCGFGGLIDHLYVSNKEQARKDRGDLWDVVAEAEGVAPARWLHVGDNEQSDIQAACDRGLQFFHVMNPAPLARLRGLAPPPPGGPTFWAPDLVLGPALLRLAGDPFQQGRPFRSRHLGSARELGYVVFGPLIYTFLSWIVSHAARGLTERLCFLAREGFMLQQAYEALRARCGDLSLPESVYLLTSRRAALGASQAAHFSPGRIASGGGGFRGLFQDLLLNRIGYVLEDEALGAWPVRLPRDAAAVKAALKVLRKPITAYSKEELAAYRNYLSKMGLTSGGVYGVVDVGYSGTIQKSLQEILDATFVGFYMATSPEAADVEKGGGFAFGCFSEETNHRDSTAPVMKHSLVMESFLTAPHGQVTHFDDAGPVMKPQRATDADLAVLHDLHAGAIEYCLELIDTYGSDLLFTVSVSEQVQEPLRMFCAGELTADAEVLSALCVEDEYCGNEKLEPLKRSA